MTTISPAHMTADQLIAWLEEHGATVTCVNARKGHRLVTVRIPGFHPATSQTIAEAVAHVEANRRHFVEAGATHGPTGARLTWG